MRDIYKELYDEQCARILAYAGFHGSMISICHALKAGTPSKEFVIGEMERRIHDLDAALKIEPVVGPDPRD
jgi:hypothetical protein